MKPHSLLLLALALLFCAPLHSADIVALCIGNDRYAKPEDMLDTPVADARLMKRTLEALPGGADVVLLEDASREDIVIELNSLAQRAQGAKLVLVYYSGHGLEGQPKGYLKADTFLLPVEAEIPDVNYLPTRAVGLKTVLETLGQCPVTARAVILDCCRDGAPRATAALKGATKSFGDIDEAVKAALGAATVPEATLVAFATGAGKKAAAFLRRDDANSPFTFFIAESLATGAGNLRDLVEAAAERTEVATDKLQVPQVTYTGAASAIRQIVFREVEKPGNNAEMAELREALRKAEAEKEAERKRREEAERKAEMVGSGSPTGPTGRTETPMARTDPAPASAFPSSRSIEGGRAGEVREFGGIAMVWCPAGEFAMGSPASEEMRDDDEVPRRVILSKGFWLARTECSQAQWEDTMWSNPSHFNGAGLPVERVSWEDVQSWLKKMNERHTLPDGWKWDLPTEAQWEYACRAGTTTAFSFGSVLDGTQANCDGRSPYGIIAKGSYAEKTAAIVSYLPNAWGIYDMHGNVREWCADWYGSYSSQAEIDPIGAKSGTDRVYRGGGWSDIAAYCRSANRSGLTPNDQLYNLGFRPAVVPRD